METKAINSDPKLKKNYNKDTYDRKLKKLRDAAGGKWWLEMYFLMYDRP